MALVGVRAQVYSLVDQWELTLGVEQVCSWEVGTGVVLGEGTGVTCGGGFPLSVVDPGPPMDVSNGLGVLASHPIPG